MIVLVTRAGVEEGETAEIGGEATRLFQLNQHCMDSTLELTTRVSI